MKCGKKIDPKCEWPFFVSLDFESVDKMIQSDYPKAVDFLRRKKDVVPQ